MTSDKSKVIATFYDGTDYKIAIINWEDVSAAPVEIISVFLKGTRIEFNQYETSFYTTIFNASS